MGLSSRIRELWPSTQRSLSGESSLLAHTFKYGLFTLRGSLGRCLSLSRHELAHHNSLAGELALDRAAALHAHCTGLPIEDVNLDAKLIAGNDLAAEFCPLDAG